MKVSVITVCYNAEKTIGATLRSVAEQRHDGFEIEHIVIDGASRDKTPDIVRAFQPAVTHFRSEPDEGLYDALNKGIALATGDIVGILNADDVFHDADVLTDVVKGFDGVDAIYGDVRFVRGEGTDTVRYYSSSPWRPWMHNWGYMPAHPTVYVRRDVFACVGTYRLGYAVSADFEWMVRLFVGRRGERSRTRYRYLPRCFVTMRLGGKSTGGWKSLCQLNRENVRANRENGYFCCLAMMVPKYAYKVWGYVFH